MLQTLIALSQVSQCLHATVQPHIYKSISIGNLHRFVRTLVVRPDLGTLVHRAEIEWDHWGQPTVDPEEVDSIQRAGEEMGVDPLAIAGSCHAYFALMLHLVPNLRVLCVRIPESPYVWHGPGDLTKWVGQRIPAGLRSLREISLFWDGFRMDDIMPFVRLPNLSTISLCGFIVEDWHWRRNHRKQFSFKNLTLRVYGHPERDVYGDARGVVDVVGMARSLEEFVWEDEEMEEGALRMLGWHSKTLKKLLISVPWQTRLSSTSWEPLPLSDFTSLRSLGIPCSFLQDSQGGQVDLFSVLPGSLEALRLDMDDWSGDESVRVLMNHNLEKWKEQRSLCLPLLEDMVCVFDWVDAGSAGKLEAMGFRVELRPMRTSTAPRERHPMIPSFIGLPS
ncbi:uncharacterized protein EI90DRAFT_3026401 [Cantharellus anzutake]|uniref:uncharacterized protein n=1 Tax=Cantharellus anzutake TaxID=1750568 RepID=UPI0019058E32|nr:uncharacterized protein EI90DRAFT_3026401 [Cantharellus anzutake]KAF8307640.1 hypothetical protein EI90DRAFT_3026401 [Cantharellus anzutake]